MDAVYVGWLSILPPMIAIILALITKEVLFSLIAGVLSGTLIYSIASGMNPIVGPVSTVFDVMIQKTDDVGVKRVCKNYLISYIVP
ncbi:hypothetical protein LIQ95_16540, partial [[Ruminococcus] gnavus]|nr:hypothetical protein [Mediterraneibacter gnavus]